ncbi:MAG TPA: hypothetical protein VKV38_17095 [Trebonia sp.]|nr:hypothetical protein [Trebonia sp.]
MPEYPASVRPFYPVRPAGQPHLTRSLGPPWRGLEIAAGAQRGHRYDALVRRAAGQG